MSRQLARLIELKQVFEKLVDKRDYSVETYYHPETGRRCVYLQRTSHPLGKFGYTYEILDEGYDARVTVKILRAAINKQIKNAEAEAE